MSIPAQPPPPPIARRRNTVFRLYDGPIYADWLAWWTAFWTVFAGLSIGSSPDTAADSLSPWADGLLAAVFIGALLGVVPAWIRLMIRRYRAAHRSPKATGTPAAPPHPTLAPPAIEPHHRPTANDAETPPPDAQPTPVIRRQSPAPKPAPRSGEERSIPTPVDVLDTRSLANSPILTAGRTALPYPAARAIRAVQLASNRYVQYEAVIDVGEALTLTFGITAVAWLRSIGASTPALVQFQAAFRQQGVSQGHWRAVLQQLSKQFADHGEPFEGAAQALRPANRNTGLLHDLETLLHERNRWAHGARPRNPVEAGTRLVDLTPALEEAVERMGALADTSWILVESSSFSRDGSFRVNALKVMGDHPEFERIQFGSPRPLVDHDIYFSSTAGYINLTPLAVMRYCDTCKQAELCYADRNDKRDGVALKSFATGHVIFDPQLTGEITRLFDETGSASTG